MAYAEELLRLLGGDAPLAGMSAPRVPSYATLQGYSPQTPEASAIFEGPTTPRESSFSVLSGTGGGERFNIAAALAGTGGLFGGMGDLVDSSTSMAAAALQKMWEARQQQTNPRQTNPAAAGQPGRAAPAPGGIPPEFAGAVQTAAQAVGLDPALLAAVVQQESGWQPRAQSRAGAQGLGQLMPQTAAALGVTDPWDVAQNLAGTARYLRQQLDAFGGDIDKALAAYNAGPGAVQQYGGIPPYPETQAYVPAVRGYYQQFAAPQTTAALTAGLDRPAPGTAVFPVQGFSGQIAPHGAPDARGGADLFAPLGTPVLAMRGGTVAATGTTGPGGNWVQIAGDDGQQYYYAHLQAPVQAVRGQYVPAGRPLGAVGQTGNAAGTPPHLHLGIGQTIRTGTGPYGGIGTDFDATAALQQLFGGR